METHTSQLLVWMAAPASVTSTCSVGHATEGLPFHHRYFFMSCERCVHQCFVFLDETDSGAVWFGACSQGHKVAVVIKVQGPFKGGVLSTSCRRFVDCIPLPPGLFSPIVQPDCQRSL